jgi:hypothetical protein
MAEPVPRRDDDGDTPFWLSPWPFLEPDLPPPPADEPA